jgi:phosphoenolpyruvate carboxykinase (diphosphate)
LGYRITERFVHTNFGKVFDYPTAVFDEAMLKPETQDLASFVDGVNNVYEAQQRVAQIYFQDGSINDACPPLKALIHIMANGSFEGKTVNDPEIRSMFTRDYLMQSDWYQERLKIKQQRDCLLWQKHRDYILRRIGETEQTDSFNQVLTHKLRATERMLAEVAHPTYLEGLQGTLGADWVHRLGT